MSTPTRTGAGTSAGPLLAGMARWLSLAAAPTFAIMAVLAASEPAADMICSMGAMPMHGTSLLSGMTPMYVLMSLFHVGPWLKLVGK